MSAVGALVLAGYDHGGALRYTATVSAGLGSKISASLYKVFEPLRVPHPPWDCDEPVPGVVWLDPSCVAAVEYREFTPAGRLRHAAFKGLLPPGQTNPRALPLPRRR